MMPKVVTSCCFAHQIANLIWGSTKTFAKDNFVSQNVFVFLQAVGYAADLPDDAKIICSMCLL